MRHWILYSLLLALPAAGQNYNDPTYRAAVEDAKTAGPSEVSSGLTPLRADTPGLVWEGEPGHSRLLVMRWIKNSEFDDFIGRDVTLGYDAFVTVVPEVAEWFRSHHEPATVPRMEQLLGLPSQNGKTRFVQLWVWPSDLRRPSCDPEVDDTVAQVDFSQGVDRRWVRYMNDRTALCYVGPWPYPWTRLGYTYDWGASNHVGVSEFIVWPGSRVGVKAVISNEECFQSINRP